MHWIKSQHKMIAHLSAIQFAWKMNVQCALRMCMQSDAHWITALICLYYQPMPMEFLTESVVLCEIMIQYYFDHMILFTPYNLYYKEQEILLKWFKLDKKETTSFFCGINAQTKYQINETLFQYTDMVDIHII